MSFDRKRKLKACRTFEAKDGVGSVVRSRTGRTRGKQFAVTSFETDTCGFLFVYVADGVTRSVASPKKKRATHLELICSGDGQPLSDETVRRLLADT